MGDAPPNADFQLAGLFFGFELESQAPGDRYQQHGGRHHESLEYRHA